jgi:hypothetical protein
MTNQSARDGRRQEGMQYKSAQFGKDSDAEYQDCDGTRALRLFSLVISINFTNVPIPVESLTPIAHPPAKLIALMKVITVL